jgi:hypothetical protein
MSYANSHQGYQPPSPDERWPQGPRHTGQQPHIGPQHSGPPHSGPQYPGPQYTGQQPSWAQPTPAPALPARPNWQPGSGWEQTPPPPLPARGSGGKWAVIAVAVVALLGIGYWLFWPSTGTGFDVKVTKCQSSGSVATVGLEVHNRSSSTQTATIRVEYHANDGKLIDTDTVLVRDIGSGDTSRMEQSTLIDAGDGGVTCKVTGSA